MSDNTTCLTVSCGNQTERSFCGACFWKLPEDLRRRLQIGATKTKRNPDDSRAASKYALVVADAIMVLERHDGDEEKGGEADKEESEEASS